MKTVVQDLTATVEQRRREMGDLLDGALIQAQMKVAIIDRLLEGMPAGYSIKISNRVPSSFSNVCNRWIRRFRIDRKFSDTLSY